MRFLASWMLAFALALPVAGVMALARHGAKPAAPVAGLVSFELATYSSYATPSFTVTVANQNDAPVTVHTITVRFVNDRTAQVITDVTEQAGVTVPGGQGMRLTYSAPQQVVNTAVEDRDITVTVTGWS